NAVQEGRLAAARGPEQNDEFALCDVEIEVFENLDATEVEREVFDGNAGLHRKLSLHGAGGDAAYEQLAGHKIDDQGHEAGQHGCGDVDVIFRRTLSRIDDIVELNGHRVVLRAGKDHAEQEVVPDTGNLQDERHHEDRQRHGQHD